MKFGVTYELLKFHKTMTSRIPYPKWWAWYGDVNQKNRIIQAEGPDGEKRPIQLIGCNVHNLGWVRDNKYWEEGFSSPKEFMDIWIKLYNNFNPDLKVCTIEFIVLPIIEKKDVVPN